MFGKSNIFDLRVQILVLFEGCVQLCETGQIDPHAQSGIEAGSEGLRQGPSLILDPTG